MLTRASGEQVRDRQMAYQRRQWRGMEPRQEGSTAWLIAGLAVVGLGVLAWYYLEPDLRRYLKIRSM